MARTISPAVLANLPTTLTDLDFVRFNPLEVLTVADVRKKRIRNVKTLATTAVVVGVGAWLAKTLVRGYEEAKEVLDQHEARQDDAVPPLASNDHRQH